MAIYRGNGGASDITSGITLNEVTALTVRAEDASDAAAASAAAAAASEAGVAADATAAASSATNSASSATDSAASAAAAASSVSSAATSATNSANSATASAASAAASATSATNSANSATASATSATNSASSATSSANSATTATTQATNASNSASAAATSATASANSATAAATSASNASTSASTASGYATAASNSATAAAASYDSFDDRYLGSKASAPTLDNDGNALLTGALYWDTTAEQMRVYTGSSWTAAGSAVNGTSNRQVYTATASQTTFAITYDVGFVDVYLNGVKLIVGTDFTATSGTNIVLATGATAGDLVDIVAYGAFEVADTYSQAAADARFATTAQGALADSALQSADIGVSVQAYDATIVVDADIGVSVQAYDADTTKNDVANTFTAAQTFGASVVEKKVAMGANNIDLSLGNYFTYTLSGAQTLTVSNVASSGSVSAFILEVTNGGSAALSYFSGVTWAAATAPTLTAAGVDTLAFFTTDGGTTWRGFVLGLGMA